MPALPVPLALPVHPHQLEVQEFDSYDLIVDLRSPTEYAQAHLPGAVLVAWTEGEGASLSRELGSALADLPRGAAVLVYCEHGGANSARAAALLEHMGYCADVIPGGWTSVRRWVLASIEILSRVLSVRWLRSAPGGAAKAVLDYLAAEGHQVLPVAALLGQHRLPGLSLKGDVMPSQAAFETALVDTLRRLDPSRPVWVDEVLLPGGDAPTLPASLQAALRHGRALRIELAMAQRLAALRTRLDPSVLDAAKVLESLRHVLPEGARPKAVAWGERLATGTSSHETAAVMVDYMDHLYRELAPPESVRECCLALASLSDEAVRAGLAMLPPPWQNDLNVDPDQINP